jgi:prepilin-type N-terminal cleavage/methylation domain-containing protein
MKKIRSFTLIEMLVSVTISGIIITIVSIIYLNYQDYFIRFKDINDNSIRMLEFYNVCSRDFSESETVKSDKGMITFCTDTHRTSYFINDDNIIRHQQSGYDTFRIPASDLKVFSLAEIPDLIYKVSFMTILNGDELEMVFRKEYGNAVLFNYEVENGN